MPAKTAHSVSHGLNQPNECTGGRQCVCNVCSCGHHSCPPGRAHAGISLDNSPFAGHSEYDERFKQHVTPAPPRKVVAEYHKNPDRLEGQSTSKADYQAWAIERHQPHRHAPYQPNPDKFEGTSVASDEYRAWELPHREVKVVPPAKLSPEDRDWATVNRASYQGQVGAAPYHHEREQSRPLWPGQQFEGQSVAAADYTAKQISRAEPIKPPTNMHVASDSKFEGQSVAAQSYTQKEIHRAEPIKPPTNMHVANSPFEGQSVASASYTAKHFTREAPIKPPTNMHVASDSKFEGQSVAAESYVAKEIHRDAPIKPPTNMQVHLDTRFEGQSVAAESYTQKEIHRAEPIKPPTNMHTAGGKFEGQSVASESYTQKDMPARYRHQAAPYQPNPDKFEGTSSAKHDYQGATAPRTESFKPVRVYNPDAETREFGTESRQMYDAKQREHCRVFDMQGKATEKDKDGHIYYKQ